VTGEALAPDPQARQETAADSPLRGAALRESPRFRSRCHSGLSRRTRRTSPSFAHQHPSQVDNSVRFECEAGVILLPNCRPQAFRKLKPLLLKVSMRTDGGQPNATVGARRVEVDPKTGNSHSASPLARRRLPQALPLPTAQTAGHQPIEGESHAADYVGAGTGLSVSLSFGHRRYVATKAIATDDGVEKPSFRPVADGSSRRAGAPSADHRLERREVDPLRRRGDRLRLRRHRGHRLVGRRSRIPGGRSSSASRSRPFSR
jgi:hypothetical protein